MYETLQLSVRQLPVLMAETSGPATPTNKTWQLSGDQRKCLTDARRLKNQTISCLETATPKAN